MPTRSLARPIAAAALLFIVLCPRWIEAADQSQLRQGRHFTEEEGRADLERSRANLPDAAAWKEHAEAIRENILRGSKLDQLPPRSPLHPIRHSRRELNGYSVENVALEVLPGFFVTGNLYLPLDRSQPLAGVLAPHGHRENKRRYESTQIRSAAMARMGAVVFAWDMLGYGESKPCPHRHPQALRLQTYSSMRVLDFVSSLEGVDQDRLAITGGSGGGTQSFLLSAIDPRLDVSAPVVQVSAHFYGGCICESGMPIHVHGDFATNNVEIAATFAPKPLLLVSNGGDWTSNTPEVEYPFVRHVYQLLDAEENVENAHFADEEHDYGPSKRKAVYQFFAKHLGLDLSQMENDAGEIDESLVSILENEELAVFNDDHPRPAHAAKDCDQVIKQLEPKD